MLYAQVLTPCRMHSSGVERPSACTDSEDLLAVLHATTRDNGELSHCVFLECLAVCVGSYIPKTPKGDPHPLSTSSTVMENTYLTNIWTQVQNLVLLARENVWYLAYFFCSVVSK